MYGTVSVFLLVENISTSWRILHVCFNHEYFHTNLEIRGNVHANLEFFGEFYANLTISGMEIPLVILVFVLYGCK